MSEITHFRTALGGFNRSDVSDYIQKTAAQHRAEVSALQAQIDALRGEATAAKKQYEDKAEKLQQLRASLVDTASRASALLSEMSSIASEAAAIADVPGEQA